MALQTAWRAPVDDCRPLGGALGGVCVLRIHMFVLRIHGGWIRRVCVIAGLQIFNVATTTYHYCTAARTQQPEGPRAALLEEISVSPGGLASSNESRAVHVLNVWGGCCSSVGRV